MSKKAQILVEAVDMTRTATQSIERNLQGVNAAALAVAGSFQGVLAATGALSVGRAMLTNAMQAEQASNRLDAVLRATGGAAGFAKGELDGMADAMARSTQFDDESIRGAQATFLKFGNITGDVFTRGLGLAADYAAFVGTEIPDAAQAIGKALSSPVEGIGALEKQIGKLRPEQEALIKQLVEQGRVMEAQGVVLDVLQGKIGGTAEIMNTGLTGATRDAKKAWDELLEAMGKTDAIGGTATRVLRTVADALNSIKEIQEGTSGPYDESAVDSMPMPKWVGNLFKRRIRNANAELAQLRAENTFDSGAMNRAMTPRPGRAGDGGGSAASAAAAARKAAEERKKLLAAWEVIAPQLDEFQFGRAPEEFKGMGDDQKLKLILADAERLTQESAELALYSQDYNRAQVEAAEAIRRAVDPTRVISAEMEKVSQLVENGFLDPETGNTRIEALNMKLREAQGEFDNVARAARKVDDFARDMGLSFSSAFEDAIAGGKGLRDVMQGLAEDILRIATRKAITEPVGNAVSSGISSVIGSIFGGGGGGGGDVFDVLSFLAPGRESGGRVSEGQPYMVGEKRPELFVPDRSGTILPHGAEIGGGASGPVFNVDMRGASVEAVRRLETLVARVNGSIERRAVNAVADARQRGGAFAGAFGA